VLSGCGGIKCIPPFRYPGLGHSHFAEDPVFPRLLTKHGIHTVSFSSFADRHQAWWFMAGWREFHAHTLKGGGETAAKVNAAVLPRLKANGRKDNWFLHVQYWDPHRNYKVGRERMRRFYDPPMPAPCRSRSGSTFSARQAEMIWPGRFETGSPRENMRAQRNG
jgi:hypothetical protein